MARFQVTAYDEALRRRFVASKRHAIEVDFHAYGAEIARERRDRQVEPAQ